MRRGWIALIVAASLAVPGAARAELRVDWSLASREVGPKRRARVEQIAGEIARLFLTKEYADLGPWDFEAEAAAVLVQVRDFGGNKERGLHLSGAIYLNEEWLKDDTDVRLTLVHELAHAYDFCVLREMMTEYLFSPESGSARIAEKRLDERMRVLKKLKFVAEQRAHEKLERYAREHGLPVPGGH